MQLLTEKERYNYQKKIHEFSLFTVKKHESYIDLYQSLLKAYGWLDGLYGFISDLTYQEYNKDDITGLMKENKFPKGKIEEVLLTWDENGKEYALEVMKEFRRLVDFSEARNAIVMAQKCHHLNRLYLSRELEEVSKKIIEDLKQIHISFEVVEQFSKSNRKQSLSTFRESKEKLKEALVSIEELISIMKSEISSSFN